MSWPASLSRPAIPRSPIHVRGICLQVFVHTVRCSTHTVLRAAYGISDKLLWISQCNCWNNSLWNHLSAKPGKQMSLEFPGIVSLQIKSHDQGFWKLNPLAETIPLSIASEIHYNFPQNIMNHFSWGVCTTVSTRPDKSECKRKRHNFKV